MKRKIIILLLIAGLSLGGWELYNKEFKTTYTPLTYYGNIDTRTVTLGFRFLGKIDQITKEEGEPVKAGEILVVLDNADLQKSLEATQSTVQAAQAQLKKLVSPKLTPPNFVLRANLRGF